MNVKLFVKNNKVLYKIVLMVRYIQYNVVRKVLFEMGVLLRKFGLQRLSIKDLQDKYKGERCFIIATGPSLRMDDIRALRNEYTFGMNSLAKAFTELGWGPTFYGIQDNRVYLSMRSDVLKMPDTMLLLGSNLKWYSKLPEKAIVFPLDLLNHEMHPDDDYNTNFSSDCSERVYDGYSITYSLIQLAVYFGFSEIYLIGADCGYSGNKHHFIEHGVVDPHFSSAQQRQFFSYGVAKKYADEHNIKIFNATRGGALEIFSRVDFDSIVKNSVKKERNAFDCNKCS